MRPFSAALASLLVAAVVSAACGGDSGSPTPRPTRTEIPLGPDQQLFVMLGDEYTDSFIPPNGKVEKLGDGSIRMTTERGSGISLEVDWELPPSELPAGRTVVDVDVNVCGSGSGDFWETYGPYGANPVEHEALPPESDGCWHYVDEPGTDFRVEAYVVGASSLVVERIEYIVTYGP